MIQKPLYSIQEIADSMAVHKETVLRWIRGGLLKGEYESRRAGYLVKADDLRKFLIENPRYSYMLNREKDVEYVNVCKELLTELYRVECERLGKENEHGAVWNAGYSAAMERFESIIKEMIIKKGALHC